MIPPANDEVTIVSVEDASAYELRWTPTVNGTLGTWTTKLVTRTRPATSITGLSPGTTYTIQVRSFNDASGFSDWSDRSRASAPSVVSRMGIGSRI